MFYFVPGGIKSAYRTSSCLRLKGSSMPFRRRRPSTFLSNKMVSSYQFPSQQAPAKYLVMTGEPFLKGTVVGFKCSQELTISTLSTFIIIMIFQPNNFLKGFILVLSLHFHHFHQKWSFPFVFPRPQKNTKFGLVPLPRCQFLTRSTSLGPGPRRHWRVTIKGRAGRSQECFTGDGFNTLPDLAGGEKQHQPKNTTELVHFNFAFWFLLGHVNKWIQMMCTIVG